MKVLIVGEGKHELGGALESLVRRVANKTWECEMAPMHSCPMHIHPGKDGVLFKKALSWMQVAEKRGCDALVLLIDQDDDAARITALNQAQEHVTLTALPRALGVAIRSFDAWILADEQALSRVLGKIVQCQRNPEENDDPKTTCKTLCNERMSPTEMYARIAAAADIGLLERRCPGGFKPFATRIRQLPIP